MTFEDYWKDKGLYLYGYSDAEAKDIWQASQRATAERCLKIIENNHYLDGAYTDIAKEFDVSTDAKEKPNHWHSFRTEDDYD